MDSITYSSSGQFVIKKLNKEALNPVADFGLLQKLADKTNATFTPYNNLSSFLQQIDSFSPVSTIHSNEKENLLRQHSRGRHPAPPYKGDRCRLR